MVRLSCIIFLFLFTFNAANAQILKGNISNISGEPVQYSTVYIRELKQGTVANTRGDYEIRLPPGTYSISYQSLGYAIVIKNITVPENGTVVNNIILQLQYYQLPEVRISSSNEDPAYSIMRKAIGLAPYFLNQIKSYTADVYLKGNLNIIKIPKLIQRSLKIDANNTKIKAGDSFLMESVNEIRFTAPDKYVQRVISFNSTFPSEGNEISPMDFIQASFYEPVIADMAISPLSPDAFYHYNFSYEGATMQGEYMIDKITVTPKRKSQQLFSGTIYLIEDLWCLHSVDLTNENLAGKIRIQQLYVPVQDNIWLPVSHNFVVNIEIIGLRADGGYGSSVKYRDVKLNSSIPKPEIVPVRADPKQTVKIDSAKTKASEDINKLLSKEDLSNRDMVKLSRLMEKETSGKKDTGKLEIIDNTTHIIEKDAALKDSAYWADIRPIPLSEADLKSITVSRNKIQTDSLTAGRGGGNTLSISLGNNRREVENDSLSTSPKERSAFYETIRNIGFGHTWSDTNNLSFRNGGLINPDGLRFNTVDGFTYGTDFRLTKTFKNDNILSVYPELYWAFSREKLMWNINSTFNYDRLKQKVIFFRAGVTSKDFNNRGGINPFINSLTTLLIEKNYLKLYESRYLYLGHSWELLNGLYLDISGNYEKRKVLNNTTNFSFIRTAGSYTENIPSNQYKGHQNNSLLSLRDHLHYDFMAGLTYTPRQRYRISNERKIPLGSDSPTFIFSWKHGINIFNKDSIINVEQNHYDIIRIAVNNNKETGAFSEYKWIVRSGVVLSNNGIPFHDFAHFNSQFFPVLLTSYQDAFALPKFYELSTTGFFMEGHFKYTNPYMLLKLLPGLSNTLIRENISLSYLYTGTQGSYTEIGYSLSEVFLLAEIGVYTGFKNIRYNSTGIKLVLRFN